MIDGPTGLIIERDDGEGTADKACPAGQKRTDCFDDIAKFKRIYKIEMSDANANASGAQDRAYRPDEDRRPEQEERANR